MLGSSSWMPYAAQGVKGTDDDDDDDDNLSKRSSNFPRYSSRCTRKTASREVIPSPLVAEKH